MMPQSVHAGGDAAQDAQRERQCCQLEQREQHEIAGSLLPPHFHLVRLWVQIAFLVHPVHRRARPRVVAVLLGARHRKAVGLVHVTFCRTTGSAPVRPSGRFEALEGTRVPGRGVASLLGASTDASRACVVSTGPTTHPVWTTLPHPGPSPSLSGLPDVSAQPPMATPVTPTPRAIV